MDYERLKEFSSQGEEREAAQMFHEMMPRAVRAGSEKGIAYMNGSKEDISRPQVREKGGKEMRLTTFDAASSPQGPFNQIVAAVAQGIPIQCCARPLNKALSKSGISKMWMEKSREQLETLRVRPLGSIEWMAPIVDGV